MGGFGKNLTLELASKVTVDDDDDDGAPKVQDVTLTVEISELLVSLDLTFQLDTDVIGLTKLGQLLSPTFEDLACLLYPVTELSISNVDFSLGAVGVRPYCNDANCDNDRLQEISDLLEDEGAYNVLTDLVTAAINRFTPG